MFRGGNPLYPVVGTGAFFVMFWVGAVLAHDLDWPAWLIAGSGLVSGLAGATLIAGLERRDMGN
jgi:hypothetical protein